MAFAPYLRDDDKATRRDRSKPRRTQEAGRGRAEAAARDRRPEGARADPLRRLGNRRPLHRFLKARSLSATYLRDVIPGRGAAASPESIISGLDLRAIPEMAIV